MGLKRKVFAATASLLLASGVQAQSQQVAAQAASQPAATAGGSLGSPMAFGPAWRTGGVGVSGMTVDAPDQDVDGSLGLSTGFGNADKYAGLAVSIGTASLTKKNGDSFGEAGSMGFQLFKTLPGNAAMAVGVTGAAAWGSKSFKDSNSSSVYVVATTVQSVYGHALTVNVGMGNKQFQALNDDGSVKDGVSPFGSLAFYVVPQFSVIADYTGRFTNLGVSYAPFKRLPVSVSLGAFNVGERYGVDTQLMGSLGMGFQF